MPKEELWDGLFWRQVEKTETCWLWRGTCGGGGHGQLMIAGKRWLVHRLSWVLHHDREAIPEGRSVVHICDNITCVNPEHLQLRAANYGRKLTEDDVHEIYKLFTQGGHSQASLARQFGVNHNTIRHITSGVTWKRAEDRA